MKDARLLHYSHCVSDLERSRRFYVDVMGFEVVLEVGFEDEKTARVMGLPGCRFTGLFLKRDSQRIELIAFQEPAPADSQRAAASGERDRALPPEFLRAESLDAALAGSPRPRASSSRSRRARCSPPVSSAA